MSSLRLGIKLSGQETTVDTLRSVWRIADEAGFDHLWDFDQLSAIHGTAMRGTLERPIYEGWSLLAAMAASTSRIRIGCIVTGNTYRHPALLAKQAVTVDHLSNGRLEFGIGSGHWPPDYEMFGLDGMGHRVGRLRESLTILKSLWTQERTTLSGRYYRVTDAVANPKPIQSPHPPIWIGCSGEQMMRIVAEHADVWVLAGSRDPQRLQMLLERLQAACVEKGRDPAGLRRALQIPWPGSVRALEDEIGASLEMGFTEQIIYVDGPDPVKAASEAAVALPDLRRLA
jgi:probable F420-dependent oxidoreductase